MAPPRVWTGTCSTALAVSPVIAVVAVGRYPQQAGGVSIKKIVRTLRTVRPATIETNGQCLTPGPEPPAAAEEPLTPLAETGH